MPENRLHVRYPEHLADREGLVYLDGQAHKAMILDESAGGLGVIVESTSRVDQGQVIEFAEVTASSTRRRFRVIHVTSEPPFAITRLGLEWLTS